MRARSGRMQSRLRNVTAGFSTRLQARSIRCSTGSPSRCGWGPHHEAQHHAEAHDRDGGRAPPGPGRKRRRRRCRERGLCRRRHRARRGHHRAARLAERQRRREPVRERPSRGRQLAHARDDPTRAGAPRVCRALPLRGCRGRRGHVALLAVEGGARADLSYVPAASHAPPRAPHGHGASRLWRPLGMLALPLDDGHSTSGRYRYGNLTVAVPAASPGLLRRIESTC